MLGDETWLKLFPGLFIRHDGVSSFFVSLFVHRQHVTCQTSSACYMSKLAYDVKLLHLHF